MRVRIFGGRLHPGCTAADSMARRDGADIQGQRDPAADGAPPRTVVRTHAPTTPYHVLPATWSRRDAARLLRAALEGLDMGRADRWAEITLVETLDPRILEILASLIERARKDGDALRRVADGRSE